MTAFLKKMLATVIDDALMPTGKNLVPSLFFAILITILNIVCRLFKWSYGFSLWGCFGAIIILLTLLIIERSEYSAVSRLYRDAELRVKDIKARQQTISAARKNGRVAGVREERRSNAHMTDLMSAILAVKNNSDGMLMLTDTMKTTLISGVLQVKEAACFQAVKYYDTHEFEPTDANIPLFRDIVQTYYEAGGRFD